VYQRDQQEQECTCHPPAATAAESDSVSLHDLSPFDYPGGGIQPPASRYLLEDFHFAALARYRL
jgi:hypothetical protein